MRGDRGAVLAVLPRCITSAYQLSVNLGAFFGPLVTGVLQSTIDFRFGTQMVELFFLSVAIGSAASGQFAAL